MKKILIPISSHGFDPTEVAIPWKILFDEGFNIVFATPNGEKGTTDKRMLNGEDLGIFKSVLQARKDAVDAYEEMENQPSFKKPLKYEDLKHTDFDALLLPGGHDKGVKEFLESKQLQKLVVRFFNEEKPVAAICHGTVLVARSIDPSTNKSVIYDYKTTSLLKSQELFAYQLTRFWLGDYYLTYPQLTVEDEVTSALSSPSNYIRGPFPLLRDDREHLSRGFTVKDRNYLSARWPGDAYSFSNEFIKMLRE